MKQFKGKTILPDKMTFNDVIFTGDNINIAFSEHFLSNFNQESLHIDNHMINAIIDSYPSSFIKDDGNDFNITTTDVLQAISKLNLKKDPGPMKIPASVILHNWEFFMYLLCDLFNMCSAQFTFPSTWKTSYIIPIPKKGRKNDIANYRGIAIQSVIPKLYDTILTKKLNEIVMNNISQHQHGFLKRRNIITNHLETHKFISEALEEHQQVDIIYFDFSRAFDKLDHTILVRKLINIGCSYNFTKLIINFINRRSYQLKINNAETEVYVKPSSSVPQGSHVGPILYLIYSNDIPQTISSSCPRVKTLQFADDTKIMMPVNNISDCIQLERGINVIEDWANDNKSTRTA